MTWLRFKRRLKQWFGIAHRHMRQDGYYRRDGSWTTPFICLTCGKMTVLETNTGRGVWSTDCADQAEDMLAHRLIPSARMLRGAK